ncbi:hypothetical protein E2562_017873 [Oryza meyeriana var. granulata]|uniref:Uncharacterized protein n=1 Tax=Oryza meyeriana var. granulata TaxID=110450 RepID=A0A6G1DY48_9ORYZ|nr:hypothetical protein E2562_017873 [Oryza meyeriana var. granulata]
MSQCVGDLGAKACSQCRLPSTEQHHHGWGRGRPRRPQMVPPPPTSPRPPAATVRVPVCSAQPTLDGLLRKEVASCLASKFQGNLTA